MSTTEKAWKFLDKHWGGLSYGDEPEPMQRVKDAYKRLRGQRVPIAAIDALTEMVKALDLYWQYTDNEARTLLKQNVAVVRGAINSVTADRRKSLRERIYAVVSAYGLEEDGGFDHEFEEHTTQHSELSATAKEMMLEWYREIKELDAYDRMVHQVIEGVKK